MACGGVCVCVGREKDLTKVYSSKHSSSWTGEMFHAHSWWCRPRLRLQAWYQEESNSRQPLNDELSTVLR